jgi:hypothetical protein
MLACGQDGYVTFANQRCSSQCSSVLAYMFNGSVDWYMSDFTPIPELFRHDADVIIFFLSGDGVLSTTPIDDPWYRMTKPTRRLGIVGLNGSSQSYGMEIAASPVACTSQLQFCNSVSTNCGALTNYQDALIDTAPLFNTTEDWMYQETAPPTKVASRFQWFVHELTWFPMDIFNIMTTLGTTGLASRQTLGQGVQGPLPSNQWQVEVSSWWATSLAAWQAVLVERARGVQNPAWFQYRAFPQDQNQRDMCNSQVSTSLYGTFVCKYDPKLISESRKYAAHFTALSTCLGFCSPISPDFSSL